MTRRHFVILVWMLPWIFVSPFVYLRGEQEGLLRLSLATQDVITVLLRGSTIIYNFNLYGTSSSWDSAPNTFSYLDSPATTSAITYKIQAKKGTGTYYYNYTNSVASQATLTLMEIAG